MTKRKMDVHNERSILMKTYAHRLTWLAGLGMIALAVALPATASAHDHFDLSIGLGPTYVAPAYVAPAPVERRWIPGHYETRVSTVLVEPEHRVRDWVAPYTSVRVDPYGYRYSVTSPGYYRDTLVPARYESRETRVWVEGYYQDITVVPPPVVYRRPTFSLGGFFRF
jgi:hypothetical protein